MARPDSVPPWLLPYHPDHTALIPGFPAQINFNEETHGGIRREKGCYPSPS